MTKYIFITGGVVSSLGKGIASASLASILETRGLNVTLLKLDPYINVDPGTMSPYQHGEVFVTDDGAETDLDLGHYERFTNQSAKKSDSISSGKIYSNVLRKQTNTEVRLNVAFSSKMTFEAYYQPFKVHMDYEDYNRLEREKSFDLEPYNYGKD